MGHPVHPAMVHFPIATTLFTGVLDIAYFLSIFSPTSATVASLVKTLDLAIQPSMFPILSYYTTILTLIFIVPAVITGAIEFMPVLQRDGFSSNKAKTVLAHAVLNDIALFGAVYNWWSRRQVPQFTPTNVNMLVSTVLAMPACFVGASIGAELVYHYGMGFRAGSSKSGTKTKKKQ